MLDRTADGAQLFHFVMIKPTHYDDDGYPIQWVRSAIPSNTLTCLNGLAEDARRWQVLGPGVDIRLHTYDETNRRVRRDRIVRLLRHAGGKAARSGSSSGAIAATGGESKTRSCSIRATCAKSWSRPGATERSGGAPGG
jgi:hypothetical protein